MAVQRSPTRSRDALAEAEARAASLADIRRIVHLLRTEGSTRRRPVNQGSATSPRWWTATVRRPVDVDHEPVGEVSSGCGQAVYRLVQEALANAARHGSGAVADVYLRTLGGDVVVGVSNPTPGSCRPIPGWSACGSA